MRDDRIWLMMCSGLALASCANYAAVGKLSTRMTDAADVWNSEVLRSKVACRRFVQLGDGTGDCATKDRAADALIAVNNRLTRYFATLGGVALDKNYSVSGGIDDLSGSVAQIPGVNADDVTAVTELGAALANLVLQGKRERTMRRMIDEGGPPAQRIVAMMRRVAVPYFSGNLKDEAERIDQALVSTVPEPLRRLGSDRAKWCMTPPLRTAFGTDHTAFLMSLEFCRRYEDVRRDRAAIGAYDDSLAVAAKAIEELQSGSTRLSAAETARQFYERAHDLHEKVQAIRTLPETGEGQ